MKNALLSTAYLPPIQYFAKLTGYEKVFLEKQEHFLKQSFRNRCQIAGPNGMQTLNIPIVKGRDGHTPITDIRIAYQEEWQKQHWKSLVAAYGSSPFFEYYRDALEPFFLKKWEFLFDFNLELMTAIIDEIGIQCIINYTEQFTLHPDSNTTDDFRNSIHPKSVKQLNDPDFSVIPYTQVFSDRYDFIPNLSIVDLLMNEGPETLSVIESCIKTGSGSIARKQTF